MGSWWCSATTSASAGTPCNLDSVTSESDLADRFRAGDVRALARAITMVERRDPAVRALQQELDDCRWEMEFMKKTSAWRLRGVLVRLKQRLFHG